MIVPKTFHYDVDGDGVAILTLDEPETLNALTRQTYQELHDTFRALADEARVRAVVLTGAGRGFCSGGNVKTLVGALVGASAADRLDFVRLTSDTVLAMRHLRKPIVAAVNGVAVGGGAALALAADIRLAAPEAQIGFVFSRLGLCGADMGTTWLLPRLVGLGRATELLLTGEMVEAESAERWGLFNHIVGSDRLMEQALSLAKRLAEGPLLAHGLTKVMLDRESHMDLASALEAEGLAQQLCMGTDDFREAYQAYQEERAPRFTGR